VAETARFKGVPKFDALVRKTRWT